MKRCNGNINLLKAMKYDDVAGLESMQIRFVPIIGMWRFAKNNKASEAFRRKMKLDQRRVHGYRNFKNYRLRVLVECGVNL